MKRMHTDREIRAMAVDSVEQKSELKVFENIVDKDGHKRFIEGDITLESVTGVTKTYGKWSLSGTHLMCVLSLKIDDTTALSFAQLCPVLENLPKWIRDKMVVMAPNSDAISVISTKAYDIDGSTSQDFSCYLRESSSEVFMSNSSFTASADRYVRIQFDILIDNE